MAQEVGLKDRLSMHLTQEPNHVQSAMEAADQETGQRCNQKPKQASSPGKRADRVSHARRQLLMPRIASSQTGTIREPTVANYNEEVTA